MRDAKEIILELREFLSSHFEFKDNREADVILCWILGTHFNCFNSYPRLVLYGPKRSGKSKLMYFLSKVCRDPKYTINPTTAAIFRLIEKYHPVMLIDEFNVHSIKEDPDLYSLMRQGYKKGGLVYRCETGKQGIDVKEYSVFCHMAIAGLTINDDQLLDRSISINMMRSSSLAISLTEISDLFFNEDKLIKWSEIPESLEVALSKDIIGDLKIKDELLFNSGRDKELWFPLFAVANYLEKSKNIKVWDNVLGYCFESIKLKERYDVDSIDSKIIAKMQYLQTLKDFTSNELSNLMNEGTNNYKETISSKSVGHALKRLGVDFKNHSGTRHYSLPLEYYNTLRLKFNIEDEN